MTKWTRCRALTVLSWGLLAGCGGEASSAPEPSSAPLERAVSACTGPKGAYCGLVTPAEAGTPGSGNFDAPHVVMRPVAPFREELVVFLPGTGSNPQSYMDPGNADANHTLYASAVAKGYRVIGLYYQNEPTVSSLCGNDDACFLATRRTLITGDVQPGSAITSMVKGDAILPRLNRLLMFLRDTVDPSGGWDRYFTDPQCIQNCRLDSAKFIVAGSSQGGGHAAVLGKDYAVRRVVTIASPCDGLPASGSPASWTFPPLATPPGADRYRGLLVVGDGPSGYVHDFCAPVALAHWAPDRLDALGKVVLSSSDMCVASPHTCASRDGQLYSEWLELWP